MERKAASIALLVYGGISASAAGLFLAVTTFTGDYPPVARFGGTVWIFILSLIVTMPLVIPRVRDRYGSPRGAEARVPVEDAHHSR
ncbi:MAG: hypothetical protein Kow00122_05430 [Thermoleophilia bacterium]|nr:hypothetical protein [Actinomycetota bacterium]